MFREMRRKKQQLPLEDCIALLKNEPRGVLSVLGDAGYPYGVPMNFWYNEANGCLYFHCARQGHKLDAVKAWEKASFCVRAPARAETGPCIFKASSSLAASIWWRTKRKLWPLSGAWGKNSPRMPPTWTTRSPGPAAACNAWF